MSTDSGNSWRTALPYIKPKIDGGAGGLKLSHEESPVVRDLGTHLLVLYLVDEGNRFSYLNNRDLERHGVSDAELHSAAMANLLALADARLRLQAHGEIFALLLEGNFEASLLLLDPLWDNSLSEYVEDEFVVAVPSRDVLAFCSIENREGVAELRQVVERVFPGGDHTISDSLFKRSGGLWIRQAA